MKVFGLGWALLNGYGQIVNGALIDLHSAGRKVIFV